MSSVIPHPPYVATPSTDPILRTNARSRAKLGRASFNQTVRKSAKRARPCTHPLRDPSWALQTDHRREINADGTYRTGDDLFQYQSPTAPCPKSSGLRETRWASLYSRVTCMNRASRFLRPLVEDEIEAVRTIEKQARIRYRDLGGLFVRAAEAPPIAAERFTTGETVVAELDDKPQGFVLLQPLRWVALCLQRIGQPRVCWSGDWANAHECSSTSRTAIEARRFIAGNLPHSILERAVVPASGLLADTGGTDRSRPPSDLGSARYVPRYDESRNPLETSSTDRMTRAITTSSITTRRLTLVPASIWLGGSVRMAAILVPSPSPIVIETDSWRHSLVPH